MSEQEPQDQPYQDPTALPWPPSDQGSTGPTGTTGSTGSTGSTGTNQSGPRLTDSEQERAKVAAENARRAQEREAQQGPPHDKRKG